MEDIVDCSWKTDGSIDDCQVVASKTSNGANNIEIDASAVHSPVNLMAEIIKDKNDVPDSYWFAVEIVDLGGDDNNNNSSNTISVGVVSPEEFKPGYKIKGMFYNGNLTNGSAGLSIGYGPYLKSGDICVLECATTTTTSATTTTTTTDDDDTTTSGTFSMTIYVNGIKIGTGFEIEIPKNDGTTTTTTTTTTTHQSKRFSPCVHVNGKAKITTKITTEKPPNLLLPPVGQQPQHPLDGDWVIVEMKAASSMEQILPIKEENNSKVITMNLDVDSVNSSSLFISVKVCNAIRIGKGFRPRPGDDDGTIYDLTSTGKGPPMMTMMMAFPPYNKVENEISSAMEEGWKSIRFLPGDGDEDDDGLKIFGNDNNVVIARCVRKKNDDIAALTSY
jgi:hypothetical protein